KVAVRFEAAPFEAARWVSADDPAELERFVATHHHAVAEDRDGAPVYLARNAWELNTIRERFPDIRFAETRERH
ncbi:MAG TPA: peptide chain release factor 3, partial [Vineibacter sp.]|nr:peptide chain release factor 3 [Vineibacter sp.]